MSPSGRVAAPRPAARKLPPRKKASPRRPRGRAKEWELRLYVAGMTTRALVALENLRALCEEFVPGRYRIQVIDLLQHPKLAHDERIVAVPTVIRALPIPIRRFLGDLSDRERVLVGLDLRAADRRRP